MNLYVPVVEITPVGEPVTQTTSSSFASLFVGAQILSIIVGVVFLFIAFYMLRPREREQRRIQDQFMFYLILGLFFIFFFFLLEYLA